jgi:hypothetical protein
VRVLELHPYMYVVRDLLVHHHGGRAVREPVHRRCTYEARV